DGPRGLVVWADALANEGVGLRVDFVPAGGAARQREAEIVVALVELASRHEVDGAVRGERGAGKRRAAALRGRRGRRLRRLVGDDAACLHALHHLISLE